MDDSGTKVHSATSRIDLAWFQGQFRNKEIEKIPLFTWESPGGAIRGILRGILQGILRGIPGGIPRGILWGNPLGGSSRGILWEDPPGGSSGGILGGSPPGSDNTLDFQYMGAEHNPRARPPCIKNLRVASSLPMTFNPSRVNAFYPGPKRSGPVNERAEQSNT